MTTRLPLFLLLALASPSPLFADLIVGRVVDASGNGVPGVDIDVTTQSGSDPTIFNDGTDANGFFSTTVPAGLFDVSFRPPAPPASTALPALLTDVLVFGTTDLGVITLPAGVSIAGQLLDEAGLPVPNVTVDVVDRATGAKVPANQNRSDLFGLFLVTSPPSSIFLELGTGTAPGSLVSQRIPLTPTAALDLGTITLQTGYPLSGSITTQAGLPVAGLDLDVFDNATGLKLFTPHDNTDALGAFSILLPPGVYDLEICPPFSTLLVARDFEGLLFTGPLSLGVVPLENGAILSGTVRDVAGTPLPTMDVDVTRTATQLSVVTCGDDTDASGVYSVIVPFDTLDVGFAPPGRHVTPAEDLHTGLVVTASTVLDGVIPAPSSAFTAAPTSGSAPLTTVFADTSGGAVTAHSWTFGDGQTSILPSPTHVYTTPGTYTVALTVDGIGGPSTHLEPGLVTVLPSLAADFVATPLSGIAPLAVAFTDQSVGAVTSWSWSFGDGGVSSIQSPAHTYAASGTYTVALTVTGPDGTDTLSRPGYVSVSEAVPTASFLSSVQSGPAPLAVSFFDTSSGSVTGWAWSFGDGATSSIQHPVHTYASPGTYTVSLTASGPGGSSTHTEAGLVTVRPALGADFAGTPLSGTAPLAVTFTDQSVGAVTSWSWSFGDGAVSSAQSPAHTYTASGTYTVALTVTGPDGADTLSRPDYVTVGMAATPPTASFVASTQSGAAPLGVAFVDTSSGDVTSWAWSFGDGAVSSIQNPLHTFTAPGTYTVSLTASGPAGTSTHVEPGLVTVRPPLAADFTATPLSGTAPLAVSFTDLSGGSVASWSWSFGDGATSSAQSPTHTYTAGGTYTVALTVAGPDGADTLSRPGYVSVSEPAPTASFFALTQTGPAPLSVDFFDTSSGNVTSWAWSFGDGAAASVQHPLHTYVNPGTYTVSLTVTGAGGTGTHIEPGYVVVSTPSPVDFTADRTRGGAPLRVSFTDLSTDNPTFWFWTFGDGVTSSEQNPVHVYTAPGTYTVKLVVLTNQGVIQVEKNDYIRVLERRGRASGPRNGGTRNVTPLQPPTGG